MYLSPLYGIPILCDKEDLRMNGDGKVINFIKQNKVHVIIWIIGLLFFGFYLYEQLSSPAMLLHGYLLNTETKADDTLAEELSADFVKAYNVEIEKGAVTFDDHFICEPGNSKKAEETSETVHEILLSQAEQSLDFTIAPTSVMTKLIYDTSVDGTYVFSDLRTVLTDEQLKLYESHFLYVDQAVVAKIEKAADEKKDTSSIKLPDPTKPDKMKNPVPVLINVSNSPKLADIYGEKSSSLAFGVIEGTPSHLLALNFLEYIMFDEE